MKRLVTAVLVAAFFMAGAVSADVTNPRWAKIYAGINGDSSDVTARLRTLLTEAAQGNGYLKLDTGTFLLTDSIQIPAGVTLEGSGAGTKIYIAHGTNEKGICLSGNSTLKNLKTFSYRAAGATFSDGSFGCPVTVGKYSTGIGYTGWTISGVTIQSTITSGNGIFVTGGSSGRIDNIYFPNSDSLHTAIGIHWGFNTTGTDSTNHPNNIRVSNVIIDTMKLTGSRALFASGVFNCSWENVVIAKVQTMVRVYAGDYGFERAVRTKYPTAATGMDSRGLSFKNITCFDDSLAISVEGLATEAAADSIYQLPVVFDGITAYNRRGTNKAIATAYCNGVTIKNSYFNGFTYGWVPGAYSEDITLENNTFTNLQNDGLSISYSGDGKPDRIMVKDNRIYDVGLSGTDASGVKADYCKTVWIHNNKIGVTGDSLNFGVYLGSSFADSLRGFVFGNTVLGFRNKSTAGAYRMDDTPYVFLGNISLVDSAYRSSSSGLALNAWPIITDSGKGPSDSRFTSRTGTSDSLISLFNNNYYLSIGDTAKRGALQVVNAAVLNIDSTRIDEDSVVTLAVGQSSTLKGSGPLISFWSGATNTAWGGILGTRYGADSIGFDFFTEDNNTPRRVLRIRPGGTMYKVDTVADSQYVTKQYADNAAAGLVDSSVTSAKLATAVHNLFLKNADWQDSLEAAVLNADSVGGVSHVFTGLTNREVVMYSNAAGIFGADSLNPSDLHPEGATTGQLMYWNGSIWDAITMKVSDSSSLLDNFLKNVSDTLMWIDGTDTLRGYFNGSSEFIWDGPGSGPSFADSAGAVDTANVTFTTYVTNHAGGASAASVGDTANGLRGEIGDTADAVRAEITDTIEAITGDVTVSSGVSSVTAQSIVGDDVDSTAENFTFSGAYHITSAVADSAYVTANTINDTANVLRAEIGDSLNRFDDTAAVHDSLDVLRGEVGDSINSERIFDLIAPFFASNVEDGISVVTQDPDNTIDFTTDTTGTQVAAMRSGIYTNISAARDSALSDIRDTVTAIGAGEANTLSDTGTFNNLSGFGQAGGKTGTALKVKGLLEGAGITITQSGDSANQIAATLGTSIIGSEIVEQTIQGNDVDSTSENFVFNDAYRGTSAEADSILITRAELGDSVANYLPLAGGTMSGNLLMSGNLVKGLPTPVSDSDAANKAYVDGNLLQNVNIQGDITINDGRLVVNDIAYELDITDIHAPHGDSVFSLPLYDSTGTEVDSSVTDGPLHPSVKFFPNGHLGFKWWMTYTPSSTDHENPHIVVSNDGLNWGLFNTNPGGSGDTLYNPVHYPSAMANVDMAAVDHLSDPELFMTEDGVLGLCFRATDFQGAADTQAIIMSFTTDGLVWTEWDSIGTAASNHGRVNTLFKYAATDAQSSDATIMSPAIVNDTNGSYKMFVVTSLKDEQLPTVEVQATINVYESDTAHTGWSFAYTANVPRYDSVNQDFWHVDALRNGPNEIVLLIMTENRSEAGVQGKIHITRSYDDGRNFTGTTLLIDTSYADYGSGHWAARDVYKSCGVWVDNGGDRVMRLFYSARQAVGNEYWDIGATDVYFGDRRDRGYVKTDTLSVGADTLADITGTGLAVASGVLNVTTARNRYAGFTHAVYQDHTPGDSVEASLPNFENGAIESYLYRDSVLGGGTDYQDTVLLDLPMLPWGTGTCDSLVLRYKTSSATTTTSAIVDMRLVVDGTSQWTYATDEASATIERLQLAVEDTDFNAGGHVTLQIIFNGDADQWLKVYNAYLVLGE